MAGETTPDVEKQAEQEQIAKAAAAVRKRRAPRKPRKKMYYCRRCAKPKVDTGGRGKHRRFSSKALKVEHARIAHGR
mgnify:CR=1 FL=1